MTSWRPPGSILEAPDSILEAPKLDLGRFWHDFFEILGQNAKKAKNAKNACQNKTSITNAPRVGGRRCSPPGGVQWNWSQVGSKWLPDMEMRPSKSFLKLDVFQNGVLEGSRLDFGGSGPRFWRLWALILTDFKEFWDRFFGRRLARKCFLPAGSV